MDISKQTYQQLTPTHRAVACFKSIARADQGEIDRLVGNAPRIGGHGQAILALGQAMDAYNALGSHLVRSYLMVSGQMQAALSFCVGWSSAGGSMENKEYQVNNATAERLRPLCEELFSQVEAVQEVAREWCDQHNIPIDFFAGPQSFRPLAPSRDEAVSIDQETLDVVRSVFAEIKLTP